MRVLLTGGGTGGHIFPLIAVARELKRQSQETQDFGLELLFVGPDSFGKKEFFEEGISRRIILAPKWRRYFSLLNFFGILILPIGLLQSLWHLFWFMPDAVFSKGGYGSVPVVIMAWLFRIPILLHESDPVPGLANRTLSRFAEKIAISFEKTGKSLPRDKVILSGNPIRKGILQGSKEKAQELFNLTLTRPIVFVMGGSQGARRINEFILQSIIPLLAEYEIIHQCGGKNFRDLERTALGALNEELYQYYHLVPFLNEWELSHAYAASDLIVSRAGAGSIFEIAALGKPSILIPLPSSAGKHQLKNAYFYSEGGAAIVLEEANLSSHFFVQKITDLLSDERGLEKMSQAAQKFAVHDSASKIAQEIFKLTLL